jgi:hypothetical protein
VFGGFSIWKLRSKLRVFGGFSIWKLRSKLCVFGCMPLEEPLAADHPRPIGVGAPTGSPARDQYLTSI